MPTRGAGLRYRLLILRTPPNGLLLKFDKNDLADLVANILRVMGADGLACSHCRRPHFWRGVAVLTVGIEDAKLAIREIDRCPIRKM